MTHDQLPAETQNHLYAVSSYYHGDQGMLELSDLLPPGGDAKRMLAAWCSAVAASPNLMRCTRDSLASSLQDCARVGLWPGPAGHVYIIPRRRDGSWEAQAQVGWKGVVALLKRDAGVSHVDSRCVYSNERYRVRAGTEPGIDHTPLLADRGDPIAWYAVAHFADGSRAAFEIMLEAEMQAHKGKYRAAKNGGPWDVEYGEMARKTVVKRLAKHVGAGDVLAYALSLDTTTTLPDRRERALAGWDRPDGDTP